MEEAEAQAVLISSVDAAERGLATGDKARVFNDRGEILMPVKVTPRIMPGVVCIPQGAWWSPDSKGTDRRGCINTITKYQPTPLAFGNPSHTNLVQLEKIDKVNGENEDKAAGLTADGVVNRAEADKLADKVADRTAGQTEGEQPLI